MQPTPTTDCFCRSLTSKIVRLGLADDKFLYGNYMGQDRLFSYPYSYLVPKASPLKVRKHYLSSTIQCVEFFISALIDLQRDAHMAVAWTLAGGIFDKMWYDAARGRATGANPMEKSNLTSLEMTHLLGRCSVVSGNWNLPTTFRAGHFF